MSESRFIAPRLGSAAPRILCATDLSPASAPAWVQAQRFARIFDAEILLLHVLVPPLGSSERGPRADVGAESEDTARRLARDRMAGMLDSLAGPRVRVRSRVVEGPVADRILAVAESEAAELLVMGTRDKIGRGGTMPGAVAERVIRLARCPVLTVRAQLPQAVNTRRRIARIGHATDFSPSARVAWRSALAIAGATGASLDLVHVTSPPVPTSYLYPEALGRMAELLREQAEAAIGRLLAESSLASRRVRVLIGSGDAAAEVARWVAGRTMDLLVIGAGGLSGLTRSTLGSVARELVGVSPCPVLTVRSAESEAPAGTA